MPESGNASPHCRVALADDHAIVRQGLAALMERHEWIEVVGLATSGFELLRILDEVPVQVAVVDVTMPGPEISDLAAQIAERSPGTRMVALTMHGEAAVARRVLRSGFTGYVHKDDAFAELVGAIREAADGNRFVSERVRQALEATPEFADLSPQELNVLQCVSRGMTNRRIAAELEISVKTVETHRARLMRKFDVHSAPELIRIATEHRWL